MLFLFVEVYEGIHEKIGVREKGSRCAAEVGGEWHHCSSDVVGQSCVFYQKTCFSKTSNAKEGSLQLVEKSTATIRFLTIHSTFTYKCRSISRTWYDRSTLNIVCSQRSLTGSKDLLCITIPVALDSEGWRERSGWL